MGIKTIYGRFAVQCNAAAGWCAVLDVAACSLAQVCSVLESLEQEYKREEDWCGGADKLGPNSDSDHVTPMISKHLEQKEAFLKVTQSLHLGSRRAGGVEEAKKSTCQIDRCDWNLFCLFSGKPLSDICSHSA